MKLINSILAHSTSSPDKLALCTPKENLSYKELKKHVKLGVSHLKKLIIQPNSVVISLIDNELNDVVLYLSCLQHGLTLVTIDPSITDSELSYIIADCKPKYAVGSKKYETRFAKTNIVFCPINLFDLDIEESAAVDDSQLHTEGNVIQYTSGSTGQPKAIVHTPNSVLERAHNWIATAKLSKEDVHLCALTINHVYGSHYAFFPSLISGATLHIMKPSMTTPLRVVDHIKRHRVTCFYNLPFFYNLMTSLKDVSNTCLSSVRLLMCAAAVLPQNIAENFREKYGIYLNNCYGLSETGLITANLNVNQTNITSVGKPVKGIDIRLEPCDYDDKRFELLVKSSAMLDVSLNPSFCEQLKGGWLATGDIVSEDKKELIIYGRKSQFINVAGNKVIPEEVENVISSLESVSQSAVVGIKEKEGNEQIVAFVISSPGNTVSIKEILDKCTTQLSSYKVPRVIHIVDHLPKSNLGKVRKKKLVELHLELTNHK